MCATVVGGRKGNLNVLPFLKDIWILTYKESPFVLTFVLQLTVTMNRTLKFRIIYVNGVV